MSRKKILWLVSWYPNRNDAFDGDFIQRHARAAAIFHDVHVIYVGTATMEKDVEVEWNQSTGLTEQWIYFRHHQGFRGKILDRWKWKILYQKAITEYIKNNGRPDGVHVHVPWRAGLLALWMKKKFGLPYLVTEHWGIYNDTVRDRFASRSIPVRFLWKKIFHEARGFITVSRFLGAGVEKLIGKKWDALIPNVVDTTLFFPKDEKYSRFTFVHVSNMVPLKNVKDIIEAFSGIQENGMKETQLILVGNKDEELVKLAEDRGLLNQSIFFRGEIPYADVAREVQLAHCFVLNSWMENSPCVIGEALCCGLPVIATSVGGIPELVNESNGRLIPPGDKAALGMAMLDVIKNSDGFSRQTISSEASRKFSYSAISSRFQEIYGLYC